MDFQLLPVEEADLEEYKAMAQEAFQKGYEDYFGAADTVILPETDIDQSLAAGGSAAYKAVVDARMAGGAVVVIDDEAEKGHLDLLFIKRGMQGSGIGKAIWHEVERRYPKTKVWETCTPYFDKRNLHFYINVCGFSIVEFFHKGHPMPDAPEDFSGDGGEGMFAFRKRTQAGIQQ